MFLRSNYIYRKVTLVCLEENTVVLFVLILLYDLVLFKGPRRAHSLLFVRVVVVVVSYMSL